MNNHMGKLIGALLGFALMGPLGLLLGVYIGHGYDRRHYTPSPSSANGPYSGSNDPAGHIYFKTTFSVMGHIAKADGRVSENEIHIAKQVMQSMRLSRAEQARAILFFNEGKQTDFNLQVALNDLLRHCRSYRRYLLLFVQFQTQITMADPAGASIKQSILETVCRRLGIRPSYTQTHQNQHYHQHQQYHSQQRAYQYRQQRSSRQQYSSNHQRYNAGQAHASAARQDDYALLGVTRSASQKEIKRAYRKLMSRYHPDRLIARGASEKEIRQATRKTQMVQAAYKRISDGSR